MPDGGEELLVPRAQQDRPAGRVVLDPFRLVFDGHAVGPCVEADDVIRCRMQRPGEKCVTVFFEHLWRPAQRQEGAAVPWREPGRLFRSVLYRGFTFAAAGPF